MGSVPISAAIVVIMIGRKRMSAALTREREIHHHDGVLLYEAHQHDHADKGIERQSDRPSILNVSDDVKRQQRAHGGRR
jgi:hypothetical protein